jgi:hypothetical protein
MENQNLSKEFRKLEINEQATFFVLGAIDTVFNTLTNTFGAVSDVSNEFADFTRPGASEKLGAKSLDAILGLNVRTDKVVRKDSDEETTKASTTISIKPKPAAKAE